MIPKLLIFISFIVIFIFLVWEIIELRNIRKKLEKSKTNILDSNYFNLNAKLKSIISIGAFIVFIIGFLGWNSIDNINKDIKNKLLSVDSLSSSVELTITKVNNLNSFVETFYNIEKGELENIISKTKQDAKDISDQLLILSDEIKTKRSNFDIIKNLTIKGREFNPLKNKSKRFYFSELETYKGKTLPKFEKNPILMIFSNYGLNTVITEENPEYFDLTVFSHTDCVECLFDLVIFY